VPEERQRDILKRLGFGVTGGDVWEIAVPSWRRDVIGSADIVEEVIRIEGLDALLQPGAVLVFGDPFGTNEVPAFLEVAACHAAQAGHGILLALEIPAPEQPLLDAFLVSGGTPADRAALLGGRFWNRPYQDGRSSRAVYELVDRVRALRSQAPARVVGIDQPALQGSERDAFMAGKVLQAREQAPGSVTFVLTGNAHARTVKGAPWDAEFLPLGWHLEKAVGKRLLSLDASFSRGQAWVCNLLPEPVCGPREMPRPRHTLGTLWRNAVMAGDVPRVERFGARTGEGFDGIFFVGAISASGPAKAFY